MRGASQSGERRSLCVRAENPAIMANGSGVRGRVTGAAYHGATTILTVQPDASDSPELKVEQSRRRRGVRWRSRCGMSGLFRRRLAERAT